MHGRSEARGFPLRRMRKYYGKYYGEDIYIDSHLE